MVEELSGKALLYQQQMKIDNFMQNYYGHFDFDSTNEAEQLLYYSFLFYKETNCIKIIGKPNRIVMGDSYKEGDIFTIENCQIDIPNIQQFIKRQNFDWYYLEYLGNCSEKY